jgi:heterotetrameric sarcosine oxidase gamma subunit
LPSILEQIKQGVIPMSTFQPIFRSPITSTQLEDESDNPKSKIQNLKLIDLTGAPIVRIQGPAAEPLQDLFPAVPAKPGDVVDLGQGLLACLRPQEFYLFGKTVEAVLPTTTELARHFAESGQHLHATDYTHGQAVVWLVGPAAPQLLSKICGLDFRERAFPNRQVKQTNVAKIKALIVRDDEDDIPAYFLYVTRPMGQYFWETLWDAGQEFLEKKPDF